MIGLLSPYPSTQHDLYYRVSIVDWRESRLNIVKTHRPERESERPRESETGQSVLTWYTRGRASQETFGDGLNTDRQTDVRLTYPQILCWTLCYPCSSLNVRLSLALSLSPLLSNQASLSLSLYAGSVSECECERAPVETGCASVCVEGALRPKNNNHVRETSLLQTVCSVCQCED